MGIIDGIKGVYYSLEDRYYAALDRVNEAVPVYKIIDPIDRVIPSFVLFLLIIIFLLSYAALLFLSPDILQLLFAFAPEKFGAKLKVVDESASPIGGASIEAIFEGKVFSLTTDSFGEVSFDLPKKSVQAQLKVSKQDYKEESKLLLIEHNNLYTIILSLIPKLGELQEVPFDVILIDFETKRAISASATLTFSCTSGVAAPNQITLSGGNFQGIKKPVNCGELLVSVNAIGYEQKTGVKLDRSPKYIELFPLKPPVGNIKVSVVDLKNAPVSGVNVKVYNSSNILVDEKQTTSSGNSLFEEVDADTYKVTASLSGRFAEKKDVIVESGKTAEITLTLPDPPKISKKIFLKVIDSKTSSAVVEAKVNLFLNNSFDQTLNTDKNGLVSFIVTDLNTVSFVVVISHADYVVKILPVSSVDESTTTPAIVSLTPLSPDSAASITVNVIDFDTKGPISEASVLLHNNAFQDIILNYPFSLSNETGRVFFPNMPAGNYKAKASKRNQSGESEAKDANLGKNTPLDVLLTFTEGRLRITVLDSSTTAPISNASVKILNFSDSSEIDGGLTKDNGLFDSSGIPTDKTVFLSISASNYLTYVSPPIAIKRGIHSITVLLFPDVFPAPVCGNKSCEQGETTDNCSADCGAEVCGNKICEAIENPSTCAADCGTAPVCGNTICEFGESPLSCTKDCGVAPIYCNVANPGTGKIGCEAGETQQNCPEDCGFPPAPCGDNVCSAGELRTTCPQDCGVPPLPKQDVFGIGFDGFFEDSETTKKIRALESDKLLPKQLFAKWSLLLPGKTPYSNLVNFFRFGAETSAEIPLTGYKIKSKGSTIASPFSSIVQGKCYSTLTDFNLLFLIPGNCIVDSGQDASQVNVSWSTQKPSSSLVVIVPVVIEQGLAEGTEIELRYQSRGVLDGNFFQTQKFFKTFKIGEPICTPGIDCPAFLWKFFINNPLLAKQQLFNFSLDKKFALESFADYNIEAIIRNTSGKSFSSASVTVMNRNPAGVISFPGKQGSGPHIVIAGVNILEDSIHSFPTVAILSGSDTDFTELVFDVNIQQSLEDRNKALFFSILPGKRMVVQLTKTSLNPFDDNERVQGLVLDANGNVPLSNAIIKVFLPAAENPIIGYSDANGLFSVPLNVFLAPGQVVKIVVERAGYRKLELSVVVSPLVFNDPRYNCITIEQNSFSVSLDQNFDFVVKTNNCGERAEISLNIPMLYSPIKLLLEKTDSKKFVVTAKPKNALDVLNPGIYPIFVQARFESDVRVVSALLAKVIVSDPNTCFSLDKHIFDVRFEKDANASGSPGKDTGKVNNSCAVALSDAWLPELSIASREVLLRQLDFNIPESVRFNWQIDVGIVTARVTVSEKRDFNNAGGLAKIINSGTNFGTPADTLDGNITVTLQPGEIVDVNNIRFESIAYASQQCGPANTNDGYINDGRVIVDANTAGVRVFNVPCDRNGGCRWVQTLNITSAEEERAENANCFGVYPCQYSFVQVDTNTLIPAVRELRANVHSEENCAFLGFRLFGKVGRIVTVTSAEVKDKNFTIGPFPVVINPVKHTGLILGSFSYNINDYIDQNDFFVVEVDLTPKSSDSRIETWINDGRVFGKFTGNEKAVAQEAINFEIENVALTATKFSTLEVEDYVRQLK